MSHDNAAELKTAMPRVLYASRYDHSILPVTAPLISHNDRAEIFYLLDGEGKCTINSHPCTTHKNDLLLVNAGTLRSIFDQYSQDIDVVQIGIAGLELDGLPANHLVDSIRLPIIPAGKRSAAIDAITTTLVTLSSMDSTPQPVSSHLVCALIEEIEERLRAEAPKTQAQNYNIGLRIKEYLDAHYLENLKLPDIATALNISPYYLSHTFKKMTGCAPIHYVTRRRIGDAQNLLLSTDKTITDIAMECGYNNSNYFQVVFNNFVGMPPGKYRKTWKK